LSDKLLPDLPPNIPSNVCTLVLDLNETLVYSDWKVNPLFDMNCLAMFILWWKRNLYPSGATCERKRKVMKLSQCLFFLMIEFFSSVICAA